MQYYVLDLEYNQYFDFQTEYTSPPNPALTSEIVQMGVVVLDDKFNEKDKYSSLIRPFVYTRLHPYVQRMTGLNIRDLRNAPSFPEAFEAFFAFALGKRGIFCTWGADDIKELYKNILFYNLDYKRLPRRYLNVQKLFSSFSRKSEPLEPGTSSQQTGLKAAVEISGLDIVKPFHNALTDAEYTADLLRFLLADNGMAESAQIQTLSVDELKEGITGKVNGINIKLLYNHAEHLLNRKLNDNDKKAVLDIYKLGRSRRFDTAKRSKNNSKPVQ